MEDKWDGAYLLMPDGERYFWHDKAAEILLREEELFVAFGDKGYERTELMAICNDVFAWGTADAEPLPAYSLEEFYLLWKEDERWGPIKWCCVHRNEQPQSPVARDMRKAGKWDETMERLPPNTWEVVQLGATHED